MDAVTYAIVWAVLVGVPGWKVLEWRIRVHERWLREIENDEHA